MTLILDSEMSCHKRERRGVCGLYSGNQLFIYFVVVSFDSKCCGIERSGSYLIAAVEVVAQPTVQVQLQGSVY